MNLIFNTDSREEVSINVLNDNKTIRDIFDLLNYSLIVSDSIGKNDIVFSSDIALPQAKNIEELITHISYFDSVICLNVSNKLKRTEKPTRFYTVDIGVECAKNNHLDNNQIVFVLLMDSLKLIQCNIHINSDIIDEHEIILPASSIITDESRVIILRSSTDIRLNNIRQQLVTKIDSDTVTISKEMFDLLERLKPDFISIRHLATGATIVRYFNQLDYSIDLTNDQIKLNYYQREMLNIVDAKDNPNALPELIDINQVIKEKIERTFNSNYLRNYYKDYGTIINYNYHNLQIVPGYYLSKVHDSFSNKIFDKMVGSAELNLSAVRPYKIDDSRNIVRLSKSSMVLLGIDESDRIIISYKDTTCRARAMEIDSYELMKETNILFSKYDLDTIVGIPVPLRKKLLIGDVETEVIIKRDTKYLFMKTLNIQMLSVLGLLLAVFQIGEGQLIVKIVICLLLLPLIIYVSLSQQRSIVKKYKNRD